MKIKGRNSGNDRNGHSKKMLEGDHGEVEIVTPRDRNSNVEPQIVRKSQTRFTQFDDQSLAFHVKSMSTRDIVAAFRENAMRQAVALTKTEQQCLSHLDRAREQGLNLRAKPTQRLEARLFIPNLGPLEESPVACRAERTWSIKSEVWQPYF